METRLVDSDRSDLSGVLMELRDSRMMRRANDAVRRQSEPLEASESVGFFCECETASCYAPVFLSVGDFDELVAAERGWVLSDGHEPSAGAAA
jgi:hypothetical protein